MDIQRFNISLLMTHFQTFISTFRHPLNFRFKKIRWPILKVYTESYTVFKIITKFLIVTFMGLPSNARMAPKMLIVEYND